MSYEGYVDATRFLSIHDGVADPSYREIDYAAASGARQTGKNEPSEPH